MRGEDKAEGQLINDLVQARQLTLEANNVRLHKAEQQTRQIAETLHAANLALTQSFELDTVLEALLDSLVQLVPYDSASVMLLETEAHVAIRAMRGYERWTDPAQLRSITFDVQTTPTLQTVLTTQQSLVIPDTAEYPDWQEHAGLAYIRNWLGVPLLVDEQVIGLYAMDKAEPGFFTEEHVHLAEMLAAQAAIAIKNARLYGAAQQEIVKRQQVEAALQESEERYHSLFSHAPISIWEEDFSEVGQWLDGLRAAGVTDLETYLQAHPEAASYAASLIRILDVNQHTLTMFEADNKEQLLSGLSMIFEEATYESFGQELLTIWEGRDYFESDSPAITLKGNHIHRRLQIAIPRVAGRLDLSKVIIALTDITERKRAEEQLQKYREQLEENTDELTAVNEQLLKALVEQRRAEEALRRQNEYLAALHETTLGLISRLDLKEVLEVLITRAGQLLGTSHGYIYLVEPAAHRPSQGEIDGGAVLERKVGVGIFRQLTGFRLKMGEGLAGKVWQTGQPLVIDDYDVWADRSQNFDYNLIRAVTGVPLTQNMSPDASGPQVVGVLGLAYDIESDQTFEDEEVKLLSRFAQLASIALDNARLFEAVQRQRQMAESLRHVAATLSTSLDRDTVLDTIMEQLRHVIQYEGASLYLQDGDELVLASGAVLSDKYIGNRFTLSGNNPVIRPFKNKKVHIIGDTHKDLDWEIWPESEHIRGWVGVPLLAGQKAIGVLGLESAKVDAYSQEDAQVLQTFANQAAIAIENARLYSEAQKAKEAAQAANESKSAFVANVSHELRTPLTSILGFTKVIKSRLEERILPMIKTEDQKTQRTVRNMVGDMSIIISEGERLTTLINNVLDLAKIEAGKVEWQMRPLTVSEVIGQAIEATSTLLEQKNLELFKDVEDGLPEVVGDRDKLIQVLINLISNAVKFTDEGWVTCRVRLRREPGPEAISSTSGTWNRGPAVGQVNGEILVSVIDTGVGIAEADQAKVFEKFTQMGDTLTDKPQGTGLGLPICKQIVEYHGGRIWMESRPGRGSTFSFTLPVPGVQTEPEGKGGDKQNSWEVI